MAGPRTGGMAAGRAEDGVPQATAAQHALARFGRTWVLHGRSALVTRPARHPWPRNRPRSRGRGPIGRRCDPPTADPSPLDLRSSSPSAADWSRFAVLPPGRRGRPQKSPRSTASATRSRRPPGRSSPISFVCKSYAKYGRARGATFVWASRPAFRIACFDSGRDDHRLRRALLDHGVDPRLLTPALLDQVEAEAVQGVVPELAGGLDPALRLLRRPLVDPDRPPALADVGSPGSPDIADAVARRRYVGASGWVARGGVRPGRRSPASCAGRRRARRVSARRGRRLKLANRVPPAALPPWGPTTLVLG
jgi:hypothetical protein